MSAITVRSLVLVPALLCAGLVQAQTPAAAPAKNAPTTAATRWKIDSSHSELTFRIRHLVSRMNGTFGEWGGTIVGNPNRLTGGSVDIAIKTASIDTNNERRDTHLRSTDFFDAESHPTITFRSTRVQARGRNLTVHGDLTMRGVTRPVVLHGKMLDVGGVAGKRRIGFEAETTVNRMEYGVTWNRAAEGGGAVLGDEVTISIAVEAVEQS